VFKLKHHDKYIGSCKTGTIERRNPECFTNLTAKTSIYKLIMAVPFSAGAVLIRNRDLAPLVIKFIQLIAKKKPY